MVEMLKGLVAKLEEEAKNEATEKAYCDKEMSETTGKKTRNEYSCGKTH